MQTDSKISLDTDRNRKIKLGIYGGTFDPPHNGHLRAAKAFYRNVSLDRLLIVPTYIPPHKSISSSDNPQTRLDMLKIAFEDMPQAEICDYEISNHRPSYTVLTLEHFQNENTQLYFLCGTDMFLTLDEWYRAEDIFKLCTVVLMRRSEKDAKTEEQINSYLKYLEEKYWARVLVIDSEPFECSSTYLRECLGNGEPVDRLIPGKLLEYIKTNNLYGS